MTEPLAAVPEEAPPTFEFLGETFEANTDIAESALMDFALDATSGEEMDVLEGLASMLRMAVEATAPKDRKRFRATFRAKRGTAEDLVPVVTRVFGVEADRPTGASSDSSDGRDATPPKSGSSSTAAVERLFPGRPDKQAAVLQGLKSA